MRPLNSALLFLLFLSISCSIVYTPITKVDLNDGAIGDAKLYIAMYEGQSLKEIPKPFRYRFVVPYLARLVPTPPSSLIAGFDVDNIKITKLKFGIINAIALALTAWVLFFFCRRLGFDRSLSLIGGFLFLTSFYTINYAGLPLTDAMAYLFLLGSLHAILAQRDGLLFLVFTLGIFVKETVVLALLYAIFIEQSDSQRLKRIGLFLPGILAYMGLRFFILPTSMGYNYSAGQLLNLIRTYRTSLGTWIFAIQNLVFVFGILWILAYKGVRIARQDQNRDLMALLPIVPVVLIIPFMIGSDLGRIWFLGFPAMIPLALLGIRHYFFMDDTV